MASVDSVDEYEEAKQLGFRTYRYTRDEEMLEGEIRARTIRSAVRQLSAVQWHALRFG